MAEMRTLLYIFRGKLETEEVGVYDISIRARQLIGCTRSTIYAIDRDGSTIEYGPNYWLIAKNPPDEIKLAAMLVN